MVDLHTNNAIYGQSDFDGLYNDVDGFWIDTEGQKEQRVRCSHPGCITILRQGNVKIGKCSYHQKQKKINKKDAQTVAQPICPKCGSDRRYLNGLCVGCCSIRSKENYLKRKQREAVCQ